MNHQREYKLSNFKSMSCKGIVILDSMYVAFLLFLYKKPNYFKTHLWDIVKPGFY